MLACPSLPALRSVAAAALGNGYVIGATSAWSRQIYRIFGELNAEVMHEDCAVAFRSLLAGLPIAYIDEPLILYRQFAGESGFYQGSAGRLTASQRMTFLKRARIDYQQKLQDLKKISHAAAATIAEKRLQYFEAALRFETGSPGWRELLRLARQLGVAGVIRLIIKRWVNLKRDAVA